MSSLTLLLLFGSFTAGFIDSIVGGGGLIALPLTALATGFGVAAIATNKIAGTAAALVAFVIYARRFGAPTRTAFFFAICEGIGAVLGATTAPHLPVATFRWFLLATVPLILWVVYHKDLWVSASDPHAQPLSRARFTATLCAGFACGFYDGVWGPGGGTFLFLALLFVARLPLTSALVGAKLANFGSGLLSLSSYAHLGYVNWKAGVPLVIGITGGAFVGSHFAGRHLEKIVRPLLAAVAVLLALRVIFF